MRGGSSAAMQAQGGPITQRRAMALARYAAVRSVCPVLVSIARTHRSGLRLNRGSGLRSSCLLGCSGRLSSGGSGASASVSLLKAVDCSVQMMSHSGMLWIRLESKGSGAAGRTRSK